MIPSAAAAGTTATPPSSSSSSSTSNLEGWLHKKGEKGAVKAWRLRWFIKKGNKLFYYKTKAPDEEPKGFIDLLQATKVQPLFIKSRNGYGFRLTVAQRDYFLCAATYEERQWWIDQLTSHIVEFRQGLLSRNRGSTAAITGGALLSPRSNGTIEASKQHAEDTKPPHVPPEVLLSFDEEIYIDEDYSPNNEQQPTHLPPQRLDTNTNLSNNNNNNNTRTLKKTYSLEASALQRHKQINNDRPSPSPRLAVDTNSMDVRAASSSKDEEEGRKRSRFHGTMMELRPRELMEGETILHTQHRVVFYRSSAMRFQGSLFLSNFQLIFVPDPLFLPEDTFYEEVKVPMATIARVEILSSDSNGGQEGGTYYGRLFRFPLGQGKNKKHAKNVSAVNTNNESQQVEFLEVISKDIRVLRFSFFPKTDARKQFMDAISIHSPASINGMFAFAYNPPENEHSSPFSSQNNISNDRSLSDPANVGGKPAFTSKEAPAALPSPSLSSGSSSSSSSSASSRKPLPPPPRPPRQNNNNNSNKNDPTTSIFPKRAPSPPPTFSSSKSRPLPPPLPAKPPLSSASTSASSFVPTHFKSPLPPSSLDNNKQQTTNNEEQRDDDDGWKVYDAVAEYDRLGLPNDHWVLLSDVNSTFGLCPTYPQVLCLPKRFPPELLPSVKEFRTKGRIPVCCWKHPTSNAVITRCSQPRVGLSRQRGHADELLIANILRANPTSETLYLMDARPKANAMANQMAKGAGYEREDVYKDTKFKFLNIDNIHVMRESQRRILLQCYPSLMNTSPSSSSSSSSSSNGSSSNGSSNKEEHAFAASESSFSSSDSSFLQYKENDNDWNNAVNSWMWHLKSVLRGAVKVVHAVEECSCSVLIHCSDGWDRTPQVSALAQLMLDGYYRTLKGFQVLIEKEWLSFGHKFADRCGHYNAKLGNHKENEKEQAPIFHQWIECVWQLTQQYPRHFEFNEQLLIALSDNIYSGLYGTFLCNSEKERVEANLRERTFSFWSQVNHPKNTHKYLNTKYFMAKQQHKQQLNRTKRGMGVLPDFHNCSDMRRLQFWREYYFRHNEDLLPCTKL
ncbi:Myotubularin-related protein 2 [Balamuthia mandrillaris]